jgi:GcrA cell cycle regulator
MFWDETRTNLLRTLWAQGLPPTTIAAQLGARSSSSITSKAHAIKLPPRTINGGSDRALLANMPSPPRQILQAMIPVEPPPRPAEGPHVVCQWPISDLTNDGMSACCRAVRSGVYCEDHANLAYRPFDARAWKKFEAYALKSA